MSDGLKAIKRSSIVSGRRPVGEYARILARLIDLPKDEALPVPTRNNQCGHDLKNRLVAVAAKEGLEIGWDRNADATLFYFWIETPNCVAL